MYNNFMKYCPRCGCRLDPESKFCIYCGKNLDSGAKKVFGNIWKISWPVLLFFGIQSVVVIMYTIIAVFSLAFKITLSGGSAYFTEDPDALTEYVMSSLNMHLPIFIYGCATVLVFFLIFRKQWKTESFLSCKKAKPAPILLGVSFGASFNLVVLGVLSFLPIPEDLAQQDMLNNLFGAPLPVMIVNIALMAALTEEIVLRGIIQRRLMKMMKVSGAVILQAFIFGLMHFSPVQSSYAFVLGIIIGLVYYWHDSIWLPITIHFVFNATSVLLSHFAGDIELKINMVGLIIITVISLVISAGSIIELYRRRTKKNINRFYDSPNSQNNNSSNTNNITPPFIG